MSEKKQTNNATSQPAKAAQPVVQAAPAPQPQVIQQVQYVKMEQSLKGIGGWLLFFMICFALTGFSMLSIMIYNFFGPTNSPSYVVLAIFAPLIFASTITTVVLAALQVKIARITAISVYALGALSTITLVIVEALETKITGSGWASVIIGILFSLIAYGLFSLYFFMSRRVKETLVKPIKKTALIILASAVGGVTAVLLVLGLILTLSAEKTKSHMTPNDTYSRSDGSEDKKVTGPIKEIPINKVIEDTDLGYTITVKRAILNIPFDSDNYSYDGAVAVELNVVNNSEYTSSFATSNIKLNINGEDKYSSESGIRDYLANNGMSVLPSSVAQGKSSTGWIYATYNGRDSEIVVSYKRPETKVYSGTNNGTTIPAKQAEIVISSKSSKV